MPELELLRRHYPEAPAADEAARERAWDLLVARIDQPRRRRRPRPRLVLAVAAAIAAVAAPLLLLGSGERGGGASASAATRLREVASVARAQPPVALPARGRYLYVRIHSVPTLLFRAEPPFDRGIRSADDFGFAAQVPNTREIWLNGRRGHQRIVNRRAVFPTAADRRAWIAAGRPQLPGGDVVEDELGRPSPVDLPSDPDRLYSHLEREAAARESGNLGYMFTLVGDTLAAWNATPEQRAALFEVAARIPGVELLGERTDPAGRTGVAFRMRDELDPFEITLIVDPETSQLLAKTSVTLPGGAAPAGIVVESSTYDAPRLVDGIGEK
jgi:hypothetical protein